MRGGGEPAYVLCKLHDGNDGAKPNAVVNGLIDDLSYTMVVHRSGRVCGHDQTSGPDQKIAEDQSSHARDSAHQPVEAYPVGAHYVDAGVYHPQKNKNHDGHVAPAPNGRETQKSGGWTKNQELIMLHRAKPEERDNQGDEL